MSFDQIMNEQYDPASWAGKWPRDQIKIFDAWSGVHTRYGIALQCAAKLETALVMLISQTQQLHQRRLSVDALLDYLETNGGLSLGRLVQVFGKFYSLNEELRESFQKAVKGRNYLAHHFYRNRAEMLHTPEGCKALEEEIVNIQYDIDETLELLGSWRDKTFGSVSDDAMLERINEDVKKWRAQEDQMLRAILGKKNNDRTAG